MERRRFFVLERGLGGFEKVPLETAFATENPSNDFAKSTVRVFVIPNSFQREHFFSSMNLISEIVGDFPCVRGIYGRLEP